MLIITALWTRDNPRPAIPRLRTPPTVADYDALHSSGLDYEHARFGLFLVCSERVTDFPGQGASDGR